MADRNFLPLRRYWIAFARPPREQGRIVVTSWPPSACGVTALSRDDALAVLDEVAATWQRPFPPIASIIEDLDVATLPVRVVLAREPHIGRGMWYWGWLVRTIGSGCPPRTASRRGESSRGRRQRAVGDRAPVQGRAAGGVVVALIRVHLRRAALGLGRCRRIEQRCEEEMVVAVGPGQPRREREAAAFDQEMTLGARLAAIGRMRPHRVTPIVARKLALSTETRDQSSAPSAPNRSRIARCSACQTPAACPSRRRRQQVRPLPQPRARGRAFQAHPVFKTKRLPPSA